MHCNDYRYIEGDNCSTAVLRHRIPTEYRLEQGEYHRAQRVPWCAGGGGDKWSNYRPQSELFRITQD
jgi:hypothetical protein